MQQVGTFVDLCAVDPRTRSVKKMQDDAAPLPMMLLPENNNSPSSNIPFYYYLCPMQSSELSSSPPFAMQFVPQTDPVDEMFEFDGNKNAKRLEGEMFNGEMKKRMRSATREELVLVENEYMEGFHQAFIRVWNNDKKHKFYDCSCGRRRPIHDRKKIVNHIVKMHGTQLQ